MNSVYIIIMVGGLVTKVMGPLPISLKECEARVELWTKFYMADPPIYPGTPRGSVYQCIQKRGKRHV